MRFTVSASEPGWSGAAKTTGASSSSMARRLRSGFFWPSRSPRKPTGALRGADALGYRRSITPTAGSPARHGRPQQVQEHHVSQGRSGQEALDDLLEALAGDHGGGQ